MRISKLRRGSVGKVALAHGKLYIKIAPPAQRQCGNYVGAIMELCQAHGQPLPKFQMWPSTGESGQWVSRAEVSVGKEVLAEEHSGLSKMAAKQLTSKHMLPRLRAALESATMPREGTEEELMAGNHKGRLQEILSRVIGARLPHYEVQQSGSPHIPSFTAQVTAGIQNVFFTVEGPPDCTRRAAEQAAAKKMLADHITIAAQ